MEGKKKGTPSNSMELKKKNSPSPTFFRTNDRVRKFFLERMSEKTFCFDNKMIP